MNLSFPYQLRLEAWIEMKKRHLLQYSQDWVFTMHTVQNVNFTWQFKRLEPIDFTFNMRYFPRILLSSLKILPNFLSQYSNSKFYLELLIYQNEIMYLAFENPFHGL